VSGEWDAGGRDVRFLAVGGGVGVASDGDVDVFDDGLHAIGNYTHHDFCYHAGSACG
jgi:hypothetical protein